MNDGYHDALVQMDMQHIEDIVLELSKRNGRLVGSENNEYNSYIQRLEEHISKIQDGLKIENGYDVILHHVNDLIKDVEL